MANPKRTKANPQVVFRRKTAKAVTALQNAASRHFENLRTRGYVPSPEEQKKVRAWVEAEIRRINTGLERAFSKQAPTEAKASSLEWE